LLKLEDKTSLVTTVFLSSNLSNKESK